MSFQAAVVWNRGRGLPWRRRWLARLAVACATVLAQLPPSLLRRVLTSIRGAARPATYEQGLAAREAVTSVSLRCAGINGCLPRSIAAALLCRVSGTWPAWCAGVRFLPPFAAHAWIEAQGRVIGEAVDIGYYRSLIRVESGAPQEGRR